MKKETKCVIGEVVGEVILGAAVGIAELKFVDPHLNTKFEKTAIHMGTMVGSWMLGRAWAKEYYGFCDKMFGTDFMKNFK